MILDWGVHLMEAIIPIFEYDTSPAVLTYSKVGQSMTPCEIVGDKGSIIIERVGLYMGAYLVQNGEKTSLFEVVDCALKCISVWMRLKRKRK